MGDGDGPPGWLPASVGSAGRRATAADADALRSGQAWAYLAGSLEAAVKRLHSEHLPAELRGDAAAYRHLLILLALGIDEALATVTLITR